MWFGLRMGHYSMKNNSATKKSFQNNKFSFLISQILVKGFSPQQQPIKLPFSHGYHTSHKLLHLPFSFRSSYQNSSPRSSPQTSPLLSLYIFPWFCIRRARKNWSSNIKSCLKSREGKVTNKQNQNYSFFKGFPGGSDSKESASNTGDPGSTPVLGRSPGDGNGNPLQYFCLENSMNRGAWQATVHRVTSVRYDWATRIWVTTHTHIPFLNWV